jgi:hypothetical protein
MTIASLEKSMISFHRMFLLKRENMMVENTNR